MHPSSSHNLSTLDKGEKAKHRAQETWKHPVIPKIGRDSDHSWNMHGIILPCIPWANNAKLSHTALQTTGSGSPILL